MKTSTLRATRLFAPGASGKDVFRRGRHIILIATLLLAICQIAHAGISVSNFRVNADNTTTFTVNLNSADLAGLPLHNVNNSNKNYGLYNVTRNSNATGAWVPYYAATTWASCAVPQDLQQLVACWIKRDGNPKDTYTQTVPGWQNGDTVCLRGADGFPYNDPRTCFYWGAVPPTTCTISSANHALGHGDLVLANVNGSTSTTTATVQCTGDTTIKVRAVLSSGNPTSTVPVRADGSISSHLTANGVDGGTGVSIPVNANQPAGVTLVSTLATGGPTAGALQGNAALVVDATGTQLQKPIIITGNVVAPAAPKAVLNMVSIAGSQSNLAVSWGWSTTSADYGSGTVPANYSVGLFIRNDQQATWSAFRVQSADSPAASWADRIQRFHDAFPIGGIEEEASRIFGRGTWCVKLAAASTPESGGTFLPAPGTTESCVTVP